MRNKKAMILGKCQPKPPKNKPILDLDPTTNEMLPNYLWDQLKKRIKSEMAL
jgi:hypothetical protein